jgi:hypothetical protein
MQVHRVDPRRRPGQPHHLHRLRLPLRAAHRTDRVLLVHHPGDDLNDIFCEPFPGSSTSWVLPEKDFPIRNIKGFNVRTREGLGNELGRDEGSRDPPAPWLYVHLKTDYQPNDRRFFCDDGQDAVRGVRWLVLRSDHSCQKFGSSGSRNGIEGRGSIFQGIRFDEEYTSPVHQLGTRVGIPGR